MSTELVVPGALKRRLYAVDLTEEYESERTRTVVDEPADATTVSSEVVQPDGTVLHAPTLDIDLPVTLVPSTTEGHFHLHVDHLMTWPAYVTLLEALAAAGLVEPGYVAASIEREGTHVRLPWVKKPEPVPAETAAF